MKGIMESNIALGNGYMLGCMIVNVCFALIVFWCCRRTRNAVKKSGWKSFGAKTVIEIVWWGGVTVMMSITLLVSSSSSFYEYQKIINGGGSHSAVISSSVGDGKSLSK